ncbi:MAG: hypothetical protein C6W55_15660 [Thermobacillus sp.]|uniref:stalk domain-containing protein n=1 Tax=Thermobacillus sp. TaxID=2108467 RepID=UPI000E376018|nr:stalk domain-containing protein [Thermobacillus sp.]REK52641.1 MAG: hypothetical protein C6W55_15660 [Thermobacillus sp.]
MKKNISLLLVAVFLLQTAVVAAAEPEDAGYDASKLFYLADESTGYQVYFPHYVKSGSAVLAINGEAFEIETNYFDYPDGDGDVLLFEVITSDPDARYLDILISDESGQWYAAEWKGLELRGGKASVSVSRSIWEMNFQEEMLRIDIYSYDEAGDLLWHFLDLYIMFTDQEEAEPGAQEPAAEDREVMALPQTANVTVDGKTVAFHAYAINGNLYLKLRDLAMVLSGTDKPFEVKWDGARNAISLISGESYTPVGGELARSENRMAVTATPNRSKIYVDGREMQFTAYTIGGNNYFKLRDIARTFNIGVTWDAAAKMVGLDTQQDYQD